MTRTLGIFVIALLLAAPLLAGEDAAVEKFNDRAKKTSEAVAYAHVRLAKWCLKVGLNINARAQLERALKVVPEYKKAMLELGYRQKKEHGKETWVLDERRAPPAQDGDDVKPQDRKDYLDAREKLNAEAAVEYVKLARYAEKLDLAAYARVAYQQAVKYDPLNEDALKGAGWKKDELGDWISPSEAAERELTSKALLGTPPAETVEKLPDWTARVYTGDPAVGTKYGKITVISSGGDHGEVGKFAWAASKLCADLLGGEVGELRVLVSSGQNEHENYCKTRNPGIKGLAQDRWVLGTNEVEVLMDAKDDKLGMERVVYAVSVFEVRRRCGETTHPWFEVGFASNLTRRLLGRVTTAEFSGDAQGPSESGRWKRTLRQLVYDESEPALGDLIVARDPNEKQVIFAHFFVRYLCGDRAGALPAFCAAMKSSTDDNEAFKSGFNQDADQLQKLFIDWFGRN